MTENNETPKGAYSSEELAEKLKTPEVRMELMNHGARIVLNLLAGPEVWEELPPLAISPDNAVEARRVVAGNPQAFEGSSWVDSQKAVVDFMLRVLWDEFEAWALKSGRTDLLCNAIDLMNAALPPEDRII